jgi:D-glycerate 3-kinase
VSPCSLPDLITEVIGQERAKTRNRPVLIGVSGAQGSGKTTACQLVEAANRPRFAQFSIDDVYLDRTKRAELAKRVHPLFVTRGPPGTHDIGLARKTIAALSEAKSDSETALPRFDKIKDEMRPASAWPVMRGRPEAILVDAWCLGALAPKPGPPINAVEAEDEDGVWRAAQAQLLATTYADWFKSFDAIIYLRAPSWDVVRRWRGEQERTLRGAPLTGEEEAWIDRFILHYERISRAMMAGALMPATVVRLDEQRKILSCDRAEPRS